MPSWGKLLPSNYQGIFRKRNLVFVWSYSAHPKEVSHRLWNSWPSQNCQARNKVYISEYDLAYLETACDVGYLTHLYFHLHLIKPTKTEWTLKVKGKTVLDHVSWFGCADWQVNTCRSPFSLWDLAGKALLTPIRKEAAWQFKCHWTEISEVHRVLRTSQTEWKGKVEGLRR